MKLKGLSVLCLSLAALAGCDDDSGGGSTAPPTQKELIELQISPVTETTRNGAEGVLIQQDSIANFVAIGTYSNNEQEVLTDKVNWDTTSDEQLISLNQSGFVTGENTGSTGVLASIDGVTSNELLVTVGDESVTKVQISESKKTLPVGGKHKLNVLGQFSDGSILPLDSQRIQWQSIDPSIVSVDSAGVITQREEGSSIIEAQYHEFAVQSEVVGVEADLESIQVVPGEVLLPQGWTTQLYALAIYDSQTYVDITELANWEVADQQVLTLTDEAGEVLAQSAGETSISASWQGVKGSTVMSVESATLERVMLTPMTTNMRLGGSLDYSAMGIYSNGGVVDLTNSVSWSSSDSAVTYDGMGGIKSTGAMPESNPVEITVSALDSKVVATAQLTIADVEISSLIIQNADIKLGVGENTVVEITAVYDDGSTEVITAGAQFSFSNSDIVDEFAGEITAQKEGQTNFTVEYLGAVANGVITVSDRSLVSIELTPKQSEVIKGHIQKFSAIGIYDNNSTNDLTMDVIWVSSNPKFVFDPLQPGNAESNVALTDVLVSAHLEDVTSDSVSVTVIDAGEITKVLGHVKDSSIRVNQTTQLLATAVYEGGETEEVTNDVIWSESQGIVEITSDDLVTGKSVGEASISGLYKGIEVEPIDVTVEESLSDALVAIVSTIDKNILYTSQETNVVAQAIYADGNMSPIVPDWEVVNTDVARVDTNGKVTALVEGTTELIAKYNGKQHSVQLTVLQPEIVRAYLTNSLNSEDELLVDSATGLPLLNAVQFEHLQLYVWQEYTDGRKERLLNEYNVNYTLSSETDIFQTKESVIFPEKVGVVPVTVNVETQLDTVLLYNFTLNIEASNSPSYLRPIKSVADGQYYFYPATVEQANSAGITFESYYDHYIGLERVALALFGRDQAAEYCRATGFTNLSNDGIGGGDSTLVSSEPFPLSLFFNSDKANWQDPINIPGVDTPVWGSSRMVYNPWTEETSTLENGSRLAICHTGWSSAWY